MGGCRGLSDASVADAHLSHYYWRSPPQRGDHSGGGVAGEEWWDPDKA